MQRYALKLGVGASLTSPAEGPGEASPRPVVMRGLVPRGAAGRLYAFGSANSLPEGTPPTTPVVEGVVGYDHTGMIATYSDSGVAFIDTYSLTHPTASRVSRNFSTGFVGAQMAFYEGAGIARAVHGANTVTALGSQFNIDYLLYSTTAEEIVNSSGTSWAVTAAASTETGGNLDTAGDDRIFYVTVVRCIRTPIGLFGVGAESNTVTVTSASSNNAIDVDISSSDGIPAEYVIYVGENDYTYEDQPWWESASGGRDSGWEVFVGPKGKVLPAYPPSTGPMVLAGMVSLSGAGAQAEEFLVLDLPLGEAMPNLTSGHLMYPNGTAGFSPAVVQHGGRLYGISPGSIVESKGPVVGLGTGETVGQQAALRALPPNRAVVYSAGLTVANFAGDTGFFQPKLTSSDEITALVSSPAGLLVFGDNETLVARGDPGNQDFSVTVLSGSIGCDAGVKPAVLGGVVFTIHRGRLWAIRLGPGVEGVTDLLTDLSSEMVQPERYEATGGSPASFTRGGFAQVWADTLNQQLIVAADGWAEDVLGGSEGHKFWRYDFNSGAWITDPHPYSPQAEGDGVIVVPSSTGARYYRHPGFDEPQVLLERNGADVTLTYEGLTLGDEGTRKHFRRIEVYAQGAGVTGFWDDGVQDSPEIAWVVYGAADAGSGEFLSGTMTGHEVEPNHWVFTFPSGTVGNRLDFTLTGHWAAADAAAAAYIDSPIVIEFQPRYRRGWKGVRE